MSKNQEMTFLEHLERLRWHIIRAVGGVVFAAIIVGFNVTYVTDNIILAPYKADFVTHKWICQMDDELCFEKSQVFQQSQFADPKFSLMAARPSEEFTRAIMIALFAGFFIAFPYVFWEFWRFVKPGLYEKEQKSARGFVFFTSFLFFLGVAFAYYVIAPFSISFFANFSLSDSVVKMWKIGDVISLIVTICIAGGLLFQMPVFSYFLSKIGILTPKTLKQYRRHAVVVIFITSAIITPADVMSQVLLALPLVILYEISIMVSRSIEKKRVKELKKQMMEVPS